MKLKKNNFSSKFKATVGCEALRENKSINEIASEKGVHPTQINKWKKVIVEESSTLFERKNGKAKNQDDDIEELQRLVGEQAVKLAWYKKKLGTTN
jgi:transposase-like protein